MHLTYFLEFTLLLGGLLTKVLCKYLFISRATGPPSLTRGMWQGYGEIPEDASNISHSNNRKKEKKKKRLTR